MRPASRILTINEVSSGIRFEVFAAGEDPTRYLEGKIDRLGSSGTNFTFRDPLGKQGKPRRLPGADRRKAVEFLLAWLAAHPLFGSVRGIGRRGVRGRRRSEPKMVIVRLVSRAVARGSRPKMSL